MYGLHFREQLQPVVADELDGLVAALRAVFYAEHNEDGTHRDAAPEFALVPVGSVMGWMTSTAPDRWLFCDGSAISRVTYNALFKVFGITYGAGDGLLTFNLPNLSGRFLLGKATAGTGSTLGAVGGSIDHTHGGAAHTHGITSGGAHGHTVAGHVHSISSDGSHTHNHESADSNLNADFTTVQSGSGATVAADPHYHSISANEINIDSNGSHTHSGATGSATPSTDSQGAHDHGGATGSGGTGNTGASNPPFLVGFYIVFAGGAV